MKTLALSLMTFIFSSQVFAVSQPKVVTNDRANSSVNVARVVQVVNMVNNSKIMVNVTIEDLGGSTDVSPTQRVYLSLYSKGEMFDVDAAFPIADVFKFTSAKRISGGLYEVTATGFDSNGPRDTTFTIDARKAIVALEAVTCADFDCDAATNFTSDITVTEK